MDHVWVETLQKLNHVNSAPPDKGEKADPAWRCRTCGLSVFFPSMWAGSGSELRFDCIIADPRKGSDAKSTSKLATTLGVPTCEDQVVRVVMLS